MKEVNSISALNSFRVNEIVDCAVSGDGNAFAQLKEHYKDAIYFLLLKMVTNKADADTLSIRVFEEAIANFHNYNSQFPFSLWLFRIASNIAIDYLRKKRAIIRPE